MIEFAGVARRYRSLLRRPAVTALEDLSLTVRQGEVFGIAGPNGAGKSTLISLVLGFLGPSAGTVRVGGEVPRRFVTRRGVGYLPELVTIPPRWTVADALRRLAVLAGHPPAIAARRAAEEADRLGLEPHARKEVRALSKGTLQRLGIAQALLGDADLLVFDEPTHGLDPLWTQRFRDIVRDLRRPGRTMVIASHNLDELERLADRVAILHQGRLQRIVSPESGAAAGAWRLTLAAPCEALARILPDATPVPDRPLEYRVEGDLPALNAALARLLAAGALVAGFVAEQSRLETAFREVVGGDG